MGNLLDYIRWRGDLLFANDPWNEIDSLLMAQAAYVNFGENERIFENPQRLCFEDLLVTDILERYPLHVVPTSLKYFKQLMPLLARSRRFGKIRILDQINDLDEKRNIQFSAMTLQVPEMGVVVAFRGTDPTVVGWKEDFMMSYECPVPAQAEAVKYLENAAARTKEELYVTGHSKGGNLAVYASAHAGEGIQARLRSVYSFDGPGLDDETMESAGYLRIRDRITSVIPEGSVVGMLMNYHPVYKVVASSARSILQHEPFTWQVMGKEFSEREQVSVQARVMDQTMHDWLKKCTPEQRRIVVQTLFSVFEKKEDRSETDSASAEASALDAKSRGMTLYLMNNLLAMLGGNMFSTRVIQPIAQKVDDLRSRLNESEKNHFKSDVISIDNHENGFRAVEEETRKIAKYTGLNAKSRIHLQLFAEEMLSMVHAITGEMQGTFWVEKVNQRYDLHLATQVMLDKQKRELLIRSTSSRKNEAAQGFLGRLRESFEKAMLSDREQEYFNLSEERNGRMGTAKPEWDRYEQSVLLRLADNVKIGIRGEQVSLTVTKTFLA